MTIPDAVLRENRWQIGSIVFGPDRKPIPLVSSQGGKPYNYEFIKGLEQKIAALEETIRVLKASRPTGKNA